MSDTKTETGREVQALSDTMFDMPPDVMSAIEELVQRHEAVSYAKGAWEALDAHWKAVHRDDGPVGTPEMER